MKTIFAILILLSFLLTANAATNNSLTDAQLLQIKFDQKLSSQVSPDLVFHDETGKQIRLGDYFGKRPIVLILGYYTCPMLCTLVLNGLVESLQDLKLNAGNQFEVVDVSIDPDEKTEVAAEKKRAYLKLYGRPGTGSGWHFLTGNAPAIRKLADEVGFHYLYDPRAQEYAHPSGFIILTPDGKITRYFFGVNFSATDLDAALTDASAKKIGSPAEQLFLLCFHYSPLRGKYGNLVMTVVRVSGVAMMLALGVIAITQTRRKNNKSEKPK